MAWGHGLRPDRQADEREGGLTRGIIIAIMPQCAQTV
jgi:hypothetical protein